MKNIKLKRLKSIETFEELKKDDIIIVEWKEHILRTNPATSKVEVYKIQNVKNKQKEIICNLNKNLFFNYEEVIEGFGEAKGVYLVRG